MADGLSIAASAIQVADAGFKLYGALSQYIRDYVGANKHVRRLADEVRTTSWALQQLGALLKEDDDIKLCKPEAIGETEAALHGCQRAFDEVSDIIKGFLPPSKPNGSGGLAKSSISNRWKWPLKTAKVQILLAQLERLKTTLLLIFKVITYASKLASKYVEVVIKEVFLPDEKSRLLYLLKAKQDAVKVEKKLLATVVQQSPSTPIVKPVVSLGAYGQHESRLRTNKTPFDSVDGAPVGRGISDYTDEPLSYPGLTSATRAEPTPPSMSHTNFVGAVLLPEQFEIPKRSSSPIHNDTTRPNEPPRLSGRKRGLVARLDDCVAADSVLPISTSDLEHDATTVPAGDRHVHEIAEGISSNPLSEQTTDKTWAPVRKKLTKSSWKRSFTLSRESEAQRRQLVRPTEALADNAASPNPKDDSSTEVHGRPQIAELEGSVPGDAERAKVTSYIQPFDESPSALSGVGVGPKRPLRSPNKPSSYREETSMTGSNHWVSTGTLDDISPNNAIANPAPGEARNFPPSLSPADLALALSYPPPSSPADLGLAPSTPLPASPVSKVFTAGSTEPANPPISMERICSDDIDDDTWSSEASYDMYSLDLGLETGEGKARSMKPSLVLAQDSPESKAVDTTKPRVADGLTLDRDRMSFGDVERRLAVSRSDEYYQSPPGVKESISPEMYDVVECGEDSDMDGGAEDECDIDGGAEEEGDICEGAEEEGEICDGAEGESDIDGGAEEEGDMSGVAEEESADVVEETYDSVESGEDSDSDTEGDVEGEIEDMVDALVRRWTTVPI
ncbi:hypothetical protein B0A54_00860 [Friedmanniomyces endolithicus]|uniref:Fungal N-terminal domain-containing protein n=1 Tax=Friedmanniomyces endolithicus TaxID=329885 RepID=A0A4U0VHV9_9PEZI|nr:hypothetical protein B0A54_00860 [Friedmanniomyces endolithicus]